jgi:hypothetical protein
MGESRRPTGAGTLDGATSWPLAGPVSPCPAPESVSASLMSATAGLRSRTPLASYDPGSSSWRIPQLALQLTEEPIGLAPCVTWPRSGSMLGGSVYKLPRPALPTGATDSGASPGEWLNATSGPDHHQESLEAAVRCWPTPTAADSHGHAQTLECPTPGQTGGTTLTGAIRAQWPTPTAQTYGTNRGGSAGRTGPVRPSLDAAARQWSTPVASDGDGRGQWKNREASPHATRGGMPRLTEDLGALLNPHWVEALMGWPTGLTGLPSAIAGPLLAALRKRRGSRRAPAAACPDARTSSAPSGTAGASRKQ